MNAPTSMVQRASIVVAMLLGTPAQVGAQAQDLRGSTLTVEFQLAALPQMLRLCDAPNLLASFSSAGSDYPDYEWRVGLDDEIGLAAPERYLFITVSSPTLQVPCTPYMMPTAAALSARVVLFERGVAAEIPATLSIDHANATLTVQFDAARIRPAELDGDPFFAYYATTGAFSDSPSGFVTDVSGPLFFPGASPGETSLTDPRNDVRLYAGNPPRSSLYQAQGYLDLVGASLRLQASATSADPGAIGPAMTGAWMDPAQSGHGLLIEVLNDQRLLATWFTFTPDGTQQAWFVGVGTYDGNTATITDVVRPEGGRWIPNFDPARVVRQLWGRLTITFSDCNRARVHFETPSDFGVGDMELTRLTLPAGLTCPEAGQQEAAR